MPFLKLPQSKIHIAVDYYPGEKRKLQKYPSASAIKKIVADGLDVPTAEFLAYYLFHRKKSHSEYRDYRSIEERIPIHLPVIEEQIQFNGTSIQTPREVTEQIPEITEHVGESIGLCVMNRIHGLTEADWDIIPIDRGPLKSRSFDFSIASDGKQLIEVETKGSAVDDNNRASGLSTHKRRIVVKKEALKPLKRQKGVALPLRYGTISALDNRSESIAKCWLVDPEPIFEGGSPRDFQLVRRMRFLYGWISYVAPRSYLAATLATRLAALESLGALSALDGVPLLRGNGERFDFSPILDGFTHSTFAAAKSRVTDGPSCGVTFQMSKERLFFLGIREQLLQLSADQSFEEISSFKFDAGTTTKSVKCVFSQTRFSRLRLPEQVVEGVTEQDGYRTFTLQGVLHYSPGGLVFGVLPLEVG